MALANKENHPSTAVHNKFSKLISAYTGDDPLATWVAYESVVPCLRLTSADTSNRSMTSRLTRTK